MPTVGGCGVASASRGACPHALSAYFAIYTAVASFYYSQGSRLLPGRREDRQLHGAGRKRPIVVMRRYFCAVLCLRKMEQAMARRPPPPQTHFALRSAPCDGVGSTEGLPSTTAV